MSTQSLGLQRRFLLLWGGRTVSILGASVTLHGGTLDAEFLPGGDGRFVVALPARAKVGGSSRSLISDVPLSDRLLLVDKMGLLSGECAVGRCPAGRWREAA